ncbi:MAG: hypothetical protein ACP5H5_09835 [Pyrobaculum sp.]
MTVVSWRGNMEQVLRELEAVPVRAPRGFSAGSVREDRDSR